MYVFGSIGVTLRGPFLADDVQYILDGDVDYYNDAEPATTGCPFMPGQLVNIFDVPIELGPEQWRRRSQSATDIPSTEVAERTMKPSDKFVNPRPPPRPRRMRLASSPASLIKLFGRSAHALSMSSPTLSAEPRRGSAPSATVTLKRLLHSSRQTPAGPEAEALPDADRLMGSLGGTATGEQPDPDPTPAAGQGSLAWPERRSLFAARRASRQDDGIACSPKSGSPLRHPPRPATGVHAAAHEPAASVCRQTAVTTFDTPELRLQLPSPAMPLSPSSHTPISPPSHPLTARALPSHDECPSDPTFGLATGLLTSASYRRGLGIDDTVTSRFSLYSTPSARSVVSRDYFDGTLADDGDGDCHGDIETVTSPTLSTSDTCDLHYPSDTGPSAAASPCSTDVFEEPLLDSVAHGRRPTDVWAQPGFPSYRLPEGDDHDSSTAAATIRKLHSSSGGGGGGGGVVVLPSSVSNVSIVTHDSHDSHNRVLPDWKDRPEQHVGLLDEIIDDLAYLGNAISSY